jgi:hypothetical protein
MKTMAQEHWFDVFSKAASRAANRRAVARSFAALVPSLLLGGLAGGTVGKGEKGNGKGKGGGKGKGNGKKRRRKRPDHLGEPDPNRDDCERFFGDDPDFVNECREDMRQCHTPDHFCIHAIDGDGDDDRGYSCCSDDEACCLFGCKDLRTDRANCGACGEDCAEGEECRDGKCGVTCGSAFCVTGTACCVDRCHDPNIYVCCPDGTACPAQTHECYVLPIPYPDGSPAYGCVGKNIP